jgi:hypothetical protein
LAPGAPVFPGSAEAIPQGRSFGTAPAHVFLPLTGRHIMARFESIAFGFCASFAAILTVATLSPIA